MNAQHKRLIKWAEGWAQDECGMVSQWKTAKQHASHEIPRPNVGTRPKSCETKKYSCAPCGARKALGLTYKQRKTFMGSNHGMLR